MKIHPIQPKLGSSERIFASHVNDLNDFYVHSAWSKRKISELARQLNEEYSWKLSTTTNAALHVGDYCAYPSGNNDWYRGLIRELDSNDHAIVFKIDYGDLQRIPSRFLRPLAESMFQVPCLAIHSSLANVITPDIGWPLKAIDEFRSRLTGPYLYSKFINYDEATGITEVEITEGKSKLPLNKEFEQYQTERSTLPMNDKLVYTHIPMEILGSNQPNEIHLLHYINPSRFYVYLPEKFDAHTRRQISLKEAVQNLPPISSVLKYQPVAVKDEFGVWLRGVIFDFDDDLSKINVYFIDIGQTDFIPINDIRPLPNEFLCEPALAIPCRLYNICPMNGNEQSMWKSNDEVHDEFKKLMANNATCTVVRSKPDETSYAIEINIHQKGDLAAYLIAENLVSRTTASSQPPNFHQLKRK